MNTYQAIPCARYDYLELACIRHYPLALELRSGEVLHGKAVTTETRADKSEWLVVETPVKTRSIRLDQIMAITPQQEGADFGRVSIADEQPSSESG
ncbi:Rho-binding antiterminator [Shewanella submarina]|uniref:Rho-binding antiterminator n=1 Tax=Shewanella submarina TaxID=2016376 RepID=A0ABV7GBF8_9GAMM|nr:Rho-binding antiterminator [Shewanella submarina]MCL1039439.1 Rho-binding antiterminator [Shewanella submarina]